MNSSQTKKCYYIFLLCILFLMNKTHAQNATELIVNNQELLYKQGNWFLLDIQNADTSFYKIDTTTIVFKYIDSVDLEFKNNFEINSQITLIDSFGSYYKYSLENSPTIFKNKVQLFKSSPLIELMVLSDLGKLNSNDPLFVNQKYLLSNFFDIESNRGYWGYGNPNVTVAVIDGFVDWSHPDLGMGNGTYQNIWINKLI